MKATPPPRGYILPIWDQSGQYRATAIAYMQREKVSSVKNANGETYTLDQLQKAVTR